jgi:hypothetical protein
MNEEMTVLEIYIKILNEYEYRMQALIEALRNEERTVLLDNK